MTFFLLIARRPTNGGWLRVYSRPLLICRKCRTIHAKWTNRRKINKFLSSRCFLWRQRCFLSFFLTILFCFAVFFVLLEFCYFSIFLCRRNKIIDKKCYSCIIHIQFLTSTEHAAWPHYPFSWHRFAEKFCRIIKTSCESPLALAKNADDEKLLSINVNPGKEADWRKTTKDQRNSISLRKSRETQPGRYQLISNLIDSKYHIPCFVILKKHRIITYEVVGQIVCRCEIVGRNSNVFLTKPGAKLLI